jgi:hypothetical protein
MGAKSSKAEKPGIIWSKRPKPMEGCSVRGRRNHMKIGQ